MSGKNLIWKESINGRKMMTDSMPVAYSEKIRELFSKYGRIDHNFTPVVSFEDNIAQKYLYVVYVTKTCRFDAQKKSSYVCCVTDIFDEALTRMNKEKEGINQAFEAALVRPIMTNVIEVCGSRSIILVMQESLITITLNRIPCTEISDNYIVMDSSVAANFSEGENQY